MSPFFGLKNEHHSTYHKELLNELIYFKCLEQCLARGLIEVLFLGKMSISGG